MKALKLLVLFGLVFQFSSFASADIISLHKKDQKKEQKDPCADDAVGKCFKEAKENNESCNDSCMRSGSGYCLQACSESYMVMFKSCAVLDQVCHR